MNLSNSTVALIVMLFCLSCGEKNRHEEASTSIEESELSLPEEPAVHVTDMVTGYIILKEALVENDIEKARIAAIEFKEITMGKVDVAFEKALVSITDNLIKAGNMEEQRQFFKQISTLMFALAENGQFKGQTLYRIFCPAAFDNEGAYWLSNNDDTFNPYLGKDILNCSIVQDTLK